MNHIELFAGCGGLSLGLETAGFDLLVANELSPMASQTFAFNHLNADLADAKNVEKVYWISSTFKRENLINRLRENPEIATGLSDDHSSDIKDNALTNTELERSLLVGSIIDLNKLLEQNQNGLLLKFKSGLGKGEVDLVSGGPPCQSFSLAGMRDHSNHRNKLPGEFANFVGMVQPRIALLENVSGILRPFNVDGEKHYAWFEVAKAFAKKNYVPICIHVNAKYVGTAQNRPRFIMIAIRKDVFERFSTNLNCEPELMEVLDESKKFFELSKEVDLKYGCLKYFDVETDDTLFENTILSPLVEYKTKTEDDHSKLVTVKDAIDDLRSNRIPESGYVQRINSVLKSKFGAEFDKNANHDLRANSDKVRARFRLYQLIAKLSPSEAKEIQAFLKTSGETGISDNVIAKLTRFWLLDTSGTKLTKPTSKEVFSVLKSLYTKKQTQRALLADQPAPAALSIPDDACHYHESLKNQRTLTVREMARIQSFPDWYKIKSKVTTGGKMRRFEVPQYTQIGNAVPPLLGLALGKVCASILEVVDKNKS